jgi:hypothetical protein
MAGGESTRSMPPGNIHAETKETKTVLLEIIRKHSPCKLSPVSIKTYLQDF